jgi:hypothetical protein
MDIFVELAIERDHVRSGRDWVLTARPRRLRIGDLVVAIAMIAIGLATIRLLDSTGRERLLVGAATLIFLGLQWAQWGLASITPSRPRPGLVVLLGISSSLLAVAMFVVLIIVGLLFPTGAALLGVLILIQVVYLTTWD